MKIGICLKVALFAFLCAIVCTIAFVLTDITLIAILTNWLWFLTYMSLVTWLCTKVYKRVRYSVNLIFIIASFAIALYTGVQHYLQGSASVNDVSSMSLTTLLFVVFTIVCLLSIMLLIGRLVFGKSRQEEAPAQEPEAPVLIAGETTWTCSCGASNSGQFCTTCGGSKPE